MTEREEKTKQLVHKMRAYKSVLEAQMGDPLQGIDVEEALREVDAFERELEEIWKAEAKTEAKAEAKAVWWRRLWRKLWR